MASLFGKGAAKATQQSSNQAQGQGSNPQQALKSPEELEAEHRAKAAFVFNDANWKKATYTERGDNEKPGEYLTRIDKMILHQSGNPSKPNTFMVIVEKTVVYVLAAGPDGDETKCSRPGDRVTQVFDFSKLPAMGNFKGMIAKILDVPPDEVPNSAAVDLTAPSQPLAGTVVRQFNRPGFTRERKPFLYVNYGGPVSFSELLGDGTEANPGLPAETRARVWKAGVLEKLAQNEKGEAPAASPSPAPAGQEEPATAQ